MLRTIAALAVSLSLVLLLINGCTTLRLRDRANGWNAEQEVVRRLVAHGCRVSKTQLYVPLADYQRPTSSELQHLIRVNHVTLPDGTYDKATKSDLEQLEYLESVEIVGDHPPSSLLTAESIEKFQSNSQRCEKVKDILQAELPGVAIFYDESFF